MFLLSRIFVIYIMAAILPALLLLVYIYNQDTVDKEPPNLLLNLLLMGVVAGLASIVLEQIGTTILDSFVSTENPAYVIFLAFLVVAVVEEGTKFYLLHRRTWKNPTSITALTPSSMPSSSPWALPLSRTSAMSSATASPSLPLGPF